MTPTALLLVQGAIVTRVNATPAVLALCPSGVVDGVQQKSAYPYIAYAEPFETPDRTFGQGGHDITFILSVYTQDGTTSKSGQGSSGNKAGLRIVEEVLRCLVDPNDGTPFTAMVVTGHDVVDVDVVSVNATTETDGITRRFDVTFTVLLEDAQ